MRRLGARGNTTASRVKTLLFHVESRHGRAAADGLLAAIKLEREYLEDETRALSRDVWHAALEAFASRFGRDEIGRVVPSVVHPENLGVWTRVLRGASDPDRAYRQLDVYGGEDVLTERWVTVSSEPAEWRGVVPIHPDLETERDGLCSMAREAELAAVPLLFGLPAATVEQPGGARETGIEFVARWAAPSDRKPVGLGLALGFVVGVVAGGLLLKSDLIAWLGLVVTSTIVGVLGGFTFVADRRRRTAAKSQLVRIQALERAAALREGRERSAIAFREGSVIGGQYRLGKQLGVGAIGTIWEAIRLSDEEPVAIKLLRAAVAHDTVTADRLRREAAALGLAWHPNVVEVLDEGYLPDGTCFLVMERLEGESLEERLNRVERLNPEELLPIALEICDALSAVHAAGVIHRDLKPSNVFVAHARPSQSARGEIVKLLDFGIARVEWAEPRLTMTGVPMGTPGYMSPEQEQGAEVDARSDLYALGGVLYRCLTGATPPERLGPALEESAEDDSSGVRPLAHLVPEHWRKVIRRATAPLPRDRFADARAMREAISHDPKTKPSAGVSGAR